jgi:hypothetical protein
MKFKKKEYINKQNEKKPIAVCSYQLEQIETTHTIRSLFYEISMKSKYNQQ